MRLVQYCTSISASNKELIPMITYGKYFTRLDLISSAFCFGLQFLIIFFFSNYNIFSIKKTKYIIEKNLVTKLIII